VPKTEVFGIGITPTGGLTPGSRQVLSDWREPSETPPAPLLLPGGLSAASISGHNLEVFFIDVEGGKATLIVSPSGESLLIDAGFDGFNNRDADRIAEAARLAGLTRIDNLVITHYHGDHVGGVRQSAAKLPITNFFDHGPTVDDGERGNGSTAHTNKSLQEEDEFGSSRDTRSR